MGYFSSVVLKHTLNKMRSLECKLVFFSGIRTHPRVQYAFSSVPSKCVWCGSNKQFSSFQKQIVLRSGISTNLLCCFFMLPHLQRLMQISVEFRQYILHYFLHTQTCSGGAHQNLSMWIQQPFMDLQELNVLTFRNQLFLSARENHRMHSRKDFKYHTAYLLVKKGENWLTFKYKPCHFKLLFYLW